MQHKIYKPDLDILAETLSDVASEWFDSLDLATYATIDPLNVTFQTRFAFNVTDQWKENQVFR